jgi:hypothetical protein
VGFGFGFGDMVRTCDLRWMGELFLRNELGVGVAG